MNLSKMGFKQSLLQRLQNIEMSAQPKTQCESKDSELQQQQQIHITDFSIQKILGESRESLMEKHKTDSSLQDTPPSSPKLYAPKATKPGIINTADILDLSKSKSQDSITIPPIIAGNTNIPSTNEFPYSAATIPPNYSGFHPNILAAVAAANAQKFYAQFLPHMFPAGLYQNVNLNRTAPYQKRYFAPYVLNPPPVLPATQAPLTPPTPTTSSTQTSSQPSTPNKYICSRSDCIDCLDSYYKSSSHSTTFPYKSPILSPTASTVSSSSSYHSKTQKDIPMLSSNISLTAVTNIHLTATKASRDILLNPAFDNRSAAGSNTEEISYKCRICDKVFGCSQTLQAHEKTHKSPRYECTDCGKGFSQLRNYKYHLSVHRGTKEFAAECPECGKTFNDKGYLSSHMKIHRNKKEYECPYCPKSFNQRVAFNMHVRIHTGVKPHKCAECGKRFSRKMLLKQHMRTHSGEKPYQCSVCGKSFADRSNMTLHHRLHSGIKPFNCPICPKAFTKKHHLKTHLNYHTGCKPYVCPHPNCNQAFTQSSNMRTHAKKCQYRPLQLSASSSASSYPVVAQSKSLSSSVAAAAVTTVTSNLSSTSSSAIHHHIHHQTSPSFMLNPISRLPSSFTSNSHLSSSGGIYNNSTLPTVSANNSNSIPFIPSTSTLSAGIRMLSTVSSTVPVTTMPQQQQQSSVFPPAQQPLLSTLRPF